MSGHDLAIGAHPSESVQRSSEPFGDRVEARDLEVAGRPGIAAYANALKRAGALAETDRSLAETVGKVRNDAAHGRFDRIDEKQADLVLLQVSLLVARLTDQEPED